MLHNNFSAIFVIAQFLFAFLFVLTFRCLIYASRSNSTWCVFFSNRYILLGLSLTAKNSKWSQFSIWCNKTHRSNHIWIESSIEMSQNFCAESINFRSKFDGYQCIDFGFGDVVSVQMEERENKIKEKWERERDLKYRFSINVSYDFGK